MFAKSPGRWVAIGLLSLFAGAAVASAENNPLYESWAKHKPGTMIKTRTVSEAAGNKTEIETTQTLKEVTPEKVVVETKNSMSMMGQTMDQPPMDMQIPAKASAETPTPAQAVEAAKKSGMQVSESEESVTVAGKSVNAKVFETKGKQGETNVHSKVWTSPEVPGMMVKLQSTTDGAMSSSTTMELLEMDLK